MVGDAQLVLLGIRAAIRLNDQYRKGFADSVRSAAITVPLPNFNPNPNLGSAINFYVGVGKEFVSSNARVTAVMKKLDGASVSALSEEEKGECLSLFREHSALLAARNNTLVVTDAANPALFTNEEALVLLTIRQWRPGQDPNPTMLRRLAGTLIETAVDYFATKPSLVSSKSPQSKALVGFLDAIGSIDFAEGQPQQIVQDLFVAAVETVRDNSSLLFDDKWAQTLVHDVTAGLYEDSKALIDSASGNLSLQERIGQWTQLIFRSVVKNAGDSVLNQPGTFFGGLNAGQTQLVTDVGKALLGAIVDDKGVSLDHLFTPTALDAITKAALGAVAAHPELVGAGGKLQPLVSEIATSLGAVPIAKGSNFLAEAVRIIIEKTGENLEVVMPAGSDPKKNLLLTASKELLAILSAPPPPGAVWTLKFTPADATTLLATVVDQVAANPDWLVARAGGTQSTLGAVTAAVLQVLRTRTSAVLSTSTGIAILTAAYGVVSKRLVLAVPDANGKILVASVLDAVFATVFSPGTAAEAKWVLVRDQALTQIVDLVFAAIARVGITPDRIVRVTAQLNILIAAIAGGQPWSFADFGIALQERLSASGTTGGN